MSKTRDFGYGMDREAYISKLESKGYTAQDAADFADSGLDPRYFIPNRKGEESAVEEIPGLFGQFPLNDASTVSKTLLLAPDLNMLAVQPQVDKLVELLRQTSEGQALVEAVFAFVNAVDIRQMIFGTLSTEPDENLAPNIVDLLQGIRKFGEQLTPEHLVKTEVNVTESYQVQE